MKQITHNGITIKDLDRSNLESVLDYWLLSSKDHLLSMGVDLNKIPTRDSLYKMIGSQIELQDDEKQSLALVAYLDNKPIGHCNVNRIKIGEEKDDKCQAKRREKHHSDTAQDKSTHMAMPPLALWFFLLVEP